MILLLTGIVLCFLITIVFRIKPSPVVCDLQRIGSRFCFSLILSSLLVKLVQIARIFIKSKISTRPKCIAPIHQILSFGWNTMILVVISLSVQPPSVTKNLQKNEDQPRQFSKANYPVYLTSHWNSKLYMSLISLFPTMH